MPTAKNGHDFSIKTIRDTYFNENSVVSFCIFNLYQSGIILAHSRSVECRPVVSTLGLTVEVLCFFFAQITKFQILFQIPTIFIQKDIFL